MVVDGRVKISENMVWIDLETTGLEVEGNSILEIAVVVTDTDLNVLFEQVIAIHQEDSVLDGMDAWCIEQHGKTGLTQACRESLIPLAEAELRIIEHLKYDCNEGRSPLCGNSVSFDRKFLKAYMPDLNRFLHYRNVDTTAVKLLARYWYPNLPEYPKDGEHRAAADIRESIEELRYYRGKVFVAPDAVKKTGALHPTSFAEVIRLGMGAVVLGSAGAIGFAAGASDRLLTATVDRLRLICRKDSSR